MAASSHHIDVISDSSVKRVPFCPHGPTLLFERYVKGEGRRQFFACSAFRDRKQCSFFRWRDEVTNNGQNDDTVDSRCNTFRGRDMSITNHSACRKRFLRFKKMPKNSRSVCCSCGVVLLPEDFANHDDPEHHTLKHRVSLSDLRQPTTLFSPNENNKTYAQYLFTDATVDFILSSLENLNYSHVLCVGAPRIHEAVQLRHRQGQKNLSSLLLDLDARYAQVYSQKELCLYNMFNNHFFSRRGKGTFRTFLQEAGTGLVLVTDPPFGGMVEALVLTFRKIEQSWTQLTRADSSLPVIWFFPYFMEKRICECMSSVTMLDYKVNYENHTLFKTKNGKKKKGSPVRIFTNISPSSLPLPAADGYWFCEVCDRYRASENLHCDKCQSCPSKDGTTYVHCDQCGRCVKPSRVHCSTCNVCDLPSHVCGSDYKEGCHICGSLEHKRRECPQKYQSAQRPKKRKRRGQDRTVMRKKRKQ